MEELLCGVNFIEQRLDDIAIGVYSSLQIINAVVRGAFRYKNLDIIKLTKPYLNDHFDTALIGACKDCYRILEGIGRN